MLTESHYIDIDVPTAFLTQADHIIEFPLEQSFVRLNKPGNVAQAALVRASQCNGNLIAQLPLVKFDFANDSCTMGIIDPLPEWLPGLVMCARTSIRIEYWLNDVRNYCKQ